MRIKVNIRTGSEVKYNGYRCKYYSEGGNYNPLGMPAVAPADQQDGFYFTEDMQLLSWVLMFANNLVITKDKWRIVYKHDIAFTNYQGFDMPNDPRADFVNKRDTAKELPKLMKGIVCSGSFIQGEAIGDKLWVYPGQGAIEFPLQHFERWESDVLPDPLKVYNV